MRVLLSTIVVLATIFAALPADTQQALPNCAPGRPLLKVPEIVEAGPGPVGQPVPPKKMAPPPFESVLNRLALGQAKKFRWIQFKLACPVSPVHQVQIWTEPGKCPRCGIFLERAALPFRLWE